ncbi:potassium-transporting ATPase subunit KdpA [Flavobacterium aquatile]|uniref:Potassium-transporting ATPase potassium-binding subunit n=1 Tax=Flavobacterium aquatile LMG 4008 = ATCC 11947 TaxID=1453498 RepID=A0A095SQF8_9FLAO|nr:potassium-transporting ATPase subunit KdpA [Flavobacterium aquatile]KGD66817.1 potassium ABC transporter ATPase [Flavobacterium aquatile LMG 4008 = ATCC 11947]OXA67910.1 potassium-transporting ATPase subunit KdpA [Flavobacterium aquatile LMG 4008 = ATCC 11947]GEC78680.1 potassium-transporting ATPase potassium-binding subunit [Flavobacterium aquatile]
MNSELLGIIFMYGLVMLLAIPLGRYIGKIFNYESTWLDKVFNPIDKLFFKIGGINPTKEMNWKQHLVALLTINIVWFVISILVLTNMVWLPLNPDGNPSMSGDLAFNTTVSFITNTNLQHYSGESGLSYLGQLTLMLWQFISAGCGMAICAAVFMAMKEKTSATLGNFYSFFVRSCTRVLLPLSFVVAIILVMNGTPMTFEGKDTITTLEGNEQNVSRGPVAAFVAIKQLGTNGGGFYGPNSANPMENPNYLTNIVENISIVLIPIAMVFALGFILKRKKLSWTIYSVMTLGFLVLLIPAVISEMNGNPAISNMGISQNMGSMEGKEVRFGAAASANWATYTTVTSNGSVNAMHDSMTPIAGMTTLLGMMINCFYGGVGVGFLNFYIFIILGVFISGLMVGRTPEFLGKKIEAKEMKIAMFIALLHPFLILVGTALASHLYASDSEALSGWLANPGYHGFSEMLYEFTSSSANNGSGFEGLGDNTPFWNIATGVVMLFARYLPIIGPVAIAGMLAQKQYIPESNGTLKTDTSTFGLMVFAVIFIVAALSFFPALTLGPIAEYFSAK